MSESFEEWAKRRSQTGGVIKRIPAQPSANRNPMDDLFKPKDKWKSADWQGNILGDLSIKRYGRSHRDKFNNLSDEIGIGQGDRAKFLDHLNNYGKPKKNPEYQQFRRTAYHGGEEGVAIGKRNKARREEEDQLKKDKDRKKAEKGRDIFKGILKVHSALGDPITKMRAASRKEEGPKPLNPDASRLQENLRKGLAPRQGMNAGTQGNQKYQRPDYENYGEVDRFLGRGLDKGVSGLAEQDLIKKMKENPTPELQAQYDAVFGGERSKGGKALDFAADMSGYIIPSLLGVGAVRGAGLGAQGMTKGMSLKNAGKLSAEGALVGGGLEALNVGAKETLNPEDQDWLANITQIGIGAAAGAILDPALMMASPAAKAFSNRYIQPLSEKLIRGEVDQAMKMQIEQTIKSGDYESLSKFIQDTPKVDGGTTFSPNAGRVDQNLNLAERPSNPLESIISPREQQQLALEHSRSQAPERATMNPDAETQAMVRQLEQNVHNASLNKDKVFEGRTARQWKDELDFVKLEAEERMASRSAQSNPDRPQAPDYALLNSPRVDPSGPQAPNYALRNPREPLARTETITPESSIEDILQYGRNQDNPITNDEIPVLYRKMQEVEEQIGQLSDKTSEVYQQNHQRLLQEDQNYAVSQANIQKATIRLEESIQNRELWDEIKTIKESFKPANRPEHFKFNIAKDGSGRSLEDFADVPNLFRSSSPNAMGIDEAATRAGYDSIEDFIAYLKSIHQSYTTKRADLDILPAKAETQLSKVAETNQKTMESTYNAATGLDELTKQIDELSTYMKPREGKSLVPEERTLSMNRNALDDLLEQRRVDADPMNAQRSTTVDRRTLGEAIDRQNTPPTALETARTIPANRNALGDLLGKRPEPKQQTISDAYGDGALDDGLIEQLLAKQKAPKIDEPKKTNPIEKIVQPKKALEKNVKQSPMSAVASTLDDYAASPQANPNTRPQTAKEMLGEVSTAVGKIRVSLDSKIQPLKALEKELTTKIRKGQLAKFEGVLDDGTLSRDVSFAKNVQMLAYSDAKAITNFKQTHKPIFDKMAKHNIKRKDMGEYIIARHAKDIYATEKDKLIRRSEVLDELERLEAMRDNTTKESEINQIAQWEKKALEELDTLDPYELPEIATEEWANHIVDTLGKKEGYAEIQQMYVSEQARNPRMLKDGKIITDKAMEAMYEKYPNYVSLSRDVDASARGRSRIGSAKNVKNPIVGRKQGSKTLLITDPFNSALANRMSTMNAVDKNKAFNSLMKLSQQEGMEGTVTRVSKHDKNFETLSKNGMLIKGFSDSGVETYVQVPKAIAEVFDSAPSEFATEYALGWARMMANAFKKGTTNLNPQFHVKSAVRDSSQMLSNSKNKAHIGDLVLGYADSFLGPKMEKIGLAKSYRKTFMDEGGDFSSFVSQNSKKDLTKVTKAAAEGHSLGHKVLDVMKLKPIENFGSKLEHGPRLAEMRAAKRKGKSDEDAFFDAIELLDYKDQGTLTRNINPYNAYFSATMRGNIRSLQQMNNPQFWKVGATMITAPTLMNEMMFHADSTTDTQRDKIRNMADWQKRTFWGVPVGGDDIILVPKPFILAQIFANPVENALRSAYDDSGMTSKEFAKEFLFDSVNTLAPPTDLIGLTSYHELQANKRFFTGMPIEDADMEKNPNVSERYNSFTSEPAKKLGKATNTSPAVLDTLMRGAFGTVGSKGLDVLDNVLAKDGERPAKTQSNKQILNPLASLTYNDASASGMYNDIYEQQKKDTYDWNKANPTGEGHPKRPPVKDRPKTPSQAAYEDLKELNAKVKEIREATHDENGKVYTAKEKNALLSPLRDQQRRRASQWQKEMAKTKK